MNEALHSFRIAIASVLAMDLPAVKQKLDTETVMEYTWKRRGGERVLLIDSVMAKARADGKETMNAYMSRVKFDSTAQGVTNVVTIDKAPEGLKKTLEDTFSVPMSKLQVDENGREVQRVITAGPGARSLVESGIISNALLFHPPFVRDRGEWQADAEVSMGTGGIAKGKLTYTKAKLEKGSQVVRVSGMLGNKGIKQSGTPLMVKDVKYIVTGEQSYDPALQEWVAGKLVMDVTFRMDVSDQPSATAKGRMTVRFAKLATK